MMEDTSLRLTPNFSAHPTSNLYFHMLRSLLLDSEGAEQDRRCWEMHRCYRPALTSPSFTPTVIQTKVHHCPTPAPNPNVAVYADCLRKKDLYHARPPPPHQTQPNPPSQLAAELEMNGSSVRKNKLMNTEVAFYFSLPPSFLFTVIKEMKST